MDPTATVLTIGLLGSTFSILAFMVWLGQRAPGSPIEKPEQPAGEDMRPHLWLGSFYINPNDPRGWVPKVNPAWGITVNFREHKFARTFLALIVLTLVCALALVLYVTCWCTLG